MAFYLKNTLILKTGFDFQLYTTFFFDFGGQDVSRGRKGFANEVSALGTVIEMDVEAAFHIHFADSFGRLHTPLRARRGFELEELFEAEQFILLFRLRIL